MCADITRQGGGWPFAEQHRARIDAHWAQVTAAKSTLWNGAALICTGATVEEGILTARLVETDYASFVAWRDWGRPDASVCNLFGVPAAITADGALLMGVMSGWTLNAGMVYPPSGTLEPKHVRADGTVDLRASMRDELMEETGLDLAAAIEGEMIAVFEGPRLAVAQRFDLALGFAEVERRFAAHRAAEAEPELERVEAVRDCSGFGSRTPLYAVEIANHFLSQPAPA